MYLVQSRMQCRHELTRQPLLALYVVERRRSESTCFFFFDTLVVASNVRPLLFFFYAQITPFREVDMHGPNMATMRRFNHYHAKMRVVVENAFGRLKGRWHVLRMIHAHPCLSASVQEACTALHNFLEERGGEYDADLEVTDEQPESSAMAAVGDASLLSAGQARRLEIVKALGLPWVEV